MAIQLLKAPNLLSPLNSNIFYQLNSNLNSIPNFKYLYEINTLEKLSTDVDKQIGEFFVPPRPGDGSGWFTPHTPLRGECQREINPYASQPILAEDNYTRWNTKMGESIPQEYPYIDTQFQSDFVSFIFSYAHQFQVGQILFNTQDNSQGFGISVNPDYEGTFSVVSVGTFSITTDIPWNLDTPAQAGVITVPFLDTIDYISTDGTIGIQFEGFHTLQTGDVIILNKTDKTWNIWLDGEWTVLETFTNSVRLDRGVPIGSTYSIGFDDGFITKVKRYSLNLGTRYGYLGTRQYTERLTDFTNEYLIDEPYLSGNGLTASGFMTDYQGVKTTWGEPETNSVFLDAGIWYPMLRIPDSTTVTTDNLVGSGSGETFANGVWTYDGIVNGRGSWIRSGATMSWSGTEWIIDNGTGTYTSSDDVESPINITSWSSGSISGNLTVSGAGQTSINGTYEFFQIVDGRNSYIGPIEGLSNITIQWNAFQSRWYISDGIEFYYADEDVIEPYLVTTWLVDLFSWGGPAPTVTIAVSGGLTLPAPTFVQQTTTIGPFLYQQVFTASAMGQYHFPTGVPNAEVYWGVSLSGVKNYEIYISDVPIL